MTHRPGWYFATRPQVDALVAKAVKLRDRGEHRKKIILSIIDNCRAERIRCSQATLYAWLKRHGVSLR